jgi:hypothetical protein
MSSFASTDIESAFEPIEVNPLSVERSPLYVAYGLVMITIFVWLTAALFGASRAVVLGFGLAFLTILLFHLLVSVLARPADIARPFNGFLLASIYFLVFDMASLREVRTFPPATLLLTYTAVSLFVITATTICSFVQPRHSPLEYLARNADRDFAGIIYFRIAIIVFILEYLRRLYFDDFSLARLYSDLLGSHHVLFRTVGTGDKWFILNVLKALFVSIPLFADRAWSRGISLHHKLVLILIVSLQLLTLVSDGIRQEVVTALFLPIMVRAAKKERRLMRWIVAAIGISFLLAPTLDLMVNVRDHGWRHAADVDPGKIHFVITSAHRDNDLFYLTSLIEYSTETGSIHSDPASLVKGAGQLAWLWLTEPIPRVFWPGKPDPRDLTNPTRHFYDADSAVGTLFYYGGFGLVVLGGGAIGLLLSLLEPLYGHTSSDGSAVFYVGLLATMEIMQRTFYPWSAIHMFVYFVIAPMVLFRLFGRRVPAAIGVRSGNNGALGISFGVI